MATMKTLNGYGFNATELNGKAASDYLQKTDTATNSAKLGGKAPKYYIQPRNLLDNSDFRNPVNQRGAISKTNNGYFIDRWMIYSQDEASRVTSIDSNGLTTAGGKAVRQIVPAELVPKDKGYTFAVCRSDGHIDFPSTWNDSNGNLVCSIDSAGTYIWAALYEGSYTADTLPPYVSKGYAAELAECQRYYFKGNGNYRASYPAFCNSETVVRATITLPTEMRITPTATISDLTKVRVFVNGTAITPTALSATAKIANNVMFEFKISGGAVNYGAIVRFGDTITLEFSADL